MFQSFGVGSELEVLGAFLTSTALLELVLLTAGSRATRSMEVNRRHQLIETLNFRLSRMNRELKHRDLGRRQTWPGFRSFALTRRVREGDGLYSLYLRAAESGPIPWFEPGQFITVRVDIEGQAHTRNYSLSESPYRRGQYRILIRKIGPKFQDDASSKGLVSNFLCSSLENGGIIQVKAPRGKFRLDPVGDSPIVLVGAGVGIAPLLSMLRSVVDGGSKRDVWLYHGVRNGTTHVMKSYLEEVGRKHPNVHVKTFYSRPRPRELVGRDFDHVGRINPGQIALDTSGKDCTYYLCCPTDLTRRIIESLEGAGVDSLRVKSETFGRSLKSVPRPGGPRTADGASPDSRCASSIENHRVTFARSGRISSWTEDRGSLLEFALESRVEIGSGCRAGRCGSCKSRIVSGAVEELCVPGHNVPADHCLPCITIPRSDLVLDV